MKNLLTQWDKKEKQKMGFNILAPESMIKKSYRV